MNLQFGRNLTLAIGIALQVLALGFCPCQFGSQARSATALPAESNGTEEADCCFCRANSEARPLCRSPLSERENRPAAVITAPAIMNDGRRGVQNTAVCQLVTLPSPDRTQFQVFLE